MRLPVLVVQLFLCLCSGFLPSASAAEPVVGIFIGTQEKIEPAPALAKNLSALIEAELSALGKVTLVERAKLDVAMKELSLVSGNDAEKLGRLIPARTLLVGSVEKSGEQFRVHFRILDLLTAKIVSAHAWPCSEAQLVVLASECARLAQRAALGEPASKATLAVLNFDYDSVAESLAPLQLRLKSMLVSRLLCSPEIFVVERENMTVLVDELELATRGAADKNALPKSLPPREASYILTGSYSGISGKSEPWIRIVAKLFKAGAADQICSLQEDTPVSALPEACERISHEVLQKIPGVAAVAAPNGDEDVSFQRHFQAALSISRKLSAVYVDLVPGLSSARALVNFSAGDGVLYPSMLKRAANELETALYFKPGDFSAKLLLAQIYAVRYCWSRERAERLLLDVVTGDRNGAYGRAARRIWTQLYSEAQYAEGYKERKAWTSKFIDAQISQFRDTPEPLREGSELQSLAMASRDLVVGKDFNKCYEISAELLRYVATQPRFQNGSTHFQIGYAADHLFCSAGELQRFDEAQDLAREVSKAVRPKDVLVIGMEWGKAARKQGRLDDALEAFNSVATVGATDSHPFFQTRMLLAKANIGEIYCLQNRDDEGIKMILAALEVNFVVCDPTTRFQFLGDHYERKGKLSEALAAYQRLYNYMPYYRNEKWLVDRIRAVQDKLGTPKPQTVATIGVKQFLPGAGERIGAIVAHEGQLWCIMSLYKDGGRLLCFDVEQLKWQEVDHEISATCLLHVPEGLYVGTAGKGLWFRAKDQKNWIKRTEADGLPFNFISDLTTLNGKVVVAFARHERGGVGFAQANGNVRLIDPPEKTKGLCVTAACGFNGMLWISHIYNKDTVWRFDPAASKWEEMLPEFSNISADPENLWLVHAPWKVSRVNANHTLDKVQIKGVPSTSKLARLNCASHFDGKLWLGGSSSGLLESCGLFSYDVETGKFSVFGPQYGIKAEEVFCLTQTADFLWCGTNNGLLRVSKQSGSVQNEGAEK